MNSVCIHPISGEVFERIVNMCAGEADVVFLHSSSTEPKNRGRYDIFGRDPFARLTVNDGKCLFEKADGTVRVINQDPAVFIDQELKRFAVTDNAFAHKVPLGGIFGYISYDFACKKQGLHAKPRKPSALVPGQDVEFLFFNTLAVRNTLSGECFVVCSDLENAGSAWMKKRITSFVGAGCESNKKNVAQKTTLAPAGVECELDFKQYSQKFLRIKQYIGAGDTYQVNFSRLFTLYTSKNAWSLYCDISKRNPVPFGHFARLKNGVEVLGFSMERFLHINGNRAHTVPIKGTAPRGKTAECDARLRGELLQSPKNRSELVMIVDLLRNDLGRFCRPGSVRVDSLFDVESYATVHHLTSTVSGVLKPGKGHAECIFDAVPGGSITGAPKHRTVEIIDELEPSNRGFYCGTFGYFGFNGVSDFNIMIRTIVKSGNKLFFKSGGGITFDSKAECEYEETIHKVAGFFGTEYL